MLGIDLVTAGTLLTLAAAGGPAGAPSNPCPFVKTVPINVRPITSDVEFDYSKSLSQLQNQEMDTINPYGFSGVTSVHGFMSANISIKPVIRIGRQFNPRVNASCLWYDTIDVTLEIEPKIVIAKEIHRDSCLRKATMEHEMKHVNVDRQIVNKYAAIIGKKIYDALAERGFRSTPVPEQHVKAMNDRMGQVVAQIIEIEHNRMQIERLDAQRGIDSLEEYERVSALCPQARAKLPGWASSKKR